MQLSIIETQTNVNDMTDIASHIRNEFRARFPEPAIRVTFNDDETIVVTLSSRIEPLMRISYVCDVASDDDALVFTNDDDAEPVVIAIPCDDE